MVTSCQAWLRVAVVLLGSGAQQAATELGVRVCIDDYSANLAKLLPHTGAAFQCHGSDKCEKLLAVHHTGCVTVGGVYARLELAFKQFLEARRAGDGEVSEETLEFVEQLEGFWDEQMLPSDLSDLALGVGFCVPPSCDEAWAALPKLVLLYFSAPPMLRAGRDAQIPPGLEPPRWKEELNVTFRGHLHPRCLGGHVEIMAFDRTPAETLSVKGELKDDSDKEDVSDRLQAAGFQLPWWVGCEGGQYHEEWRSWGRYVRTTFSRGKAGPLDRQLLFRAYRLVVQYQLMAKEWAMSTQQLSDRTWSAKYHELYSGEERSPLDYALIDPGDERWHTEELLANWARFCPYGYMVALYIVARGFQAAGFMDAAGRELRLAKAMLGPASEMDLLDPGIWRLRSSDVDLNLLREELFAEEPLPYTEVDGLADVYSGRLADPTLFVWHALQLNALVRLRLADAAATVKATEPPQLAMLASPPFLTTSLVPMLLRLWGVALQLAVFYIGKWSMDYKCRDCVADYRKRFVVEDERLQSIPLVTTGKIAWEDELMDYSELLSLLRDVLDTQPQARAADVLLCTAAGWLCLALHLVSSRPVLALCLVHPCNGAPPEMLKDYEPLTRRLRRHAAGPLLRGNPLRLLWVRDDPSRGYVLHRDSVDAFFPFVFLPSLYINARYECSEHADVLVMREGSLQRFAMTLRGRLFYAALQHMETAASPWRFHMLHYNLEHPSYEEIARHRAAVWVPLMFHWKTTIKDLITMEIPLFVPSDRLQASISARDAYHGNGCTSTALTRHAWAFTLCREVKIAPWLRLATISRYPHLLHFDGLSDLVLQLVGLGCHALAQISARMRRWNAAAVADDEVFWKDAILALKAATFQPPPLDLLPREPDADPGILASHCQADVPFDGPAFWEICQWSMSDMVRECYTTARLLQHGPFGNESLPSTAGTGCMSDPSKCDPKVLQHGTHLLQELPPLY